MERPIIDDLNMERPIIDDLSMERSMIDDLNMERPMIDDLIESVVSFTMTNMEQYCTCNSFLYHLHYPVYKSRVCYPLTNWLKQQFHYSGQTN